MRDATPITVLTPLFVMMLLGGVVLMFSNRLLEGVLVLVVLLAALIWSSI